MARITRRLSPSMVIALIALFISMGGVSYGLATGSVDSREIKNKTIRDKDIKRNAIKLGLGPNSVQGDEIVNKSIKGVDVGDQQLGDAQIREAELDIGRLGGVPASEYIYDVVQIRSVSTSALGTDTQSANATCPSGKILLGGGFRTFNIADGNSEVADSGPSALGSSTWAVEASEQAADPDWRLEAYATCGS